MKKVIVGMSGGVDSSVAAYLLKKQGYDVIGVFMQNWDPYLNNDNFNNQNVCESEYEFSIAKNVADKLGIKIYKINFIKEYWTQVFVPFLENYKKGTTPNPDVLCNKYIKFGAFHKYCFENFDVDLIATGHYAKVIFNLESNIYELHESKDTNKDQTYFLCQLNQSQLSKSIFPLGDITKKEVRKIAKENGLDNWNKKDSTGICFIGERDFKKFISNYLPVNKGKIIDIKTNKILGNHDGVHLYTIGQRKGLNLSGYQYKYFVCKKDIENNILYVTESIYENSYLYSSSCLVGEFNWISNIPKNNLVEIRFRHSPKKTQGFFENIDTSTTVINYDSKSKSVTEGQYAVIYQNGICLGGGIIKKVFL